MRKFLQSLLFIIVALFIVDRIGGMAMWWVNQHTHDVTGPKMKYLVNNVHEDILLMGTSRCNCHYVPSIISDTLGMSVFNGGIDASNNIYAHYIMLNHVLTVYHPKLICLEVRLNDFAEQPNSFNTVTFFAPYFGLNEHADSVFRLAGLYWKYCVSHLYRYNAKSASNIAGLAINRHEGGDHGYIPRQMPAQFPDSLEHLNSIKNVDKMKIQYVQRFIELCHERNIKLVFTVSPMYAYVNKDYYDVIKKIARNNEVPFLDYHTTGLFWDHPEYFLNNTHLWDKGARIYSSIFARDLKELI